MVQGAKNWGCMIASRSSKGKISEDFLVPSSKKLGVRMHPVHPLFRHPLPGMAQGAKNWGAQ